MINEQKTTWQRVRDWLTGDSVIAKRRYKAAKNSRKHRGWTNRPYAENYLLRQDLQTLRARSREQAKNNPLVKRYLSMVRSNVIGPKNLQLQCNAETPRSGPNTKLNKQIERLFWEWSFPQTCTASGKLDFLGVMNLAITQVARDGETLIQILKSDNKFGMSLRVISADYLDETYNDTRPDGNRIIMSVEINADWKPVAYWLTTPPSNIMFAPHSERRRVRVPAEQMIHAFVVLDDEEQVRGVPWTHASMVSALYLNRLDDSVLLNMTNAANTLGFIKNAIPDDATQQYTGEDGELEPLKINTEPLSWTELEPGQDIVPFKSDQPHQNMTELARRIEGHVAAGFDVPTFSINSDYSEINFSSSRMAMGEARDIFRWMQGWTAQAMCMPIYQALIKSMFLSGVLKISVKDYDEIQMPEWKGRSWDYIEPMKDTQSDILAVANGLKSMKSVLGEKGIDINDHVAEMQAEMELFANAGVPYPQQKTAPSDQPEEPDDDEPTDKKKKDKGGEV